MFRWISFSLCVVLLSWHTVYGAPRFELYAKKYLDQFAESLCKKEGVAFLNSGFGDLIDVPESHWVVTMAYRRSQTIEEIRPLVRKLIYEYLYFVYHCSYFAETAVHYKKTLNDDMVGFRLSVWDAHMNRPFAPCLAEVRFYQSKIFYYYANPETLDITSPCLIESLTDLDLPPYWPDASKKTVITN